MRTFFRTVFISYCLLLIAACSSDSNNRPTLSSELNDLVATVCQETGVPGASVYIISPDYGNFAITWGYADLSTNTPVTAAHRFRIGSLSKSFTGTAVLQLTQDGQINLEAPISDYLGEQYDAEVLAQISVNQLLTMSSGLGEYLSPQFLIDSVLPQPLTDYPPHTLVENALLNSPELLYPPGTEFSYNNTNYILLGQLIETVSGQSYHDYLQQTLLTPLALQNTFVLEDDDQPQQLVRGYYDFDEDGHYEDWTDMNMSYVWSAGCLAATAENVAIWMEALASGNLLTSPFQPQNFPGYPIAQGVTYGAGILVDDSFGIGHNGTVIGFHADAWHDPHTQTTVAVLCNTNAPILDDERDPTREIAQEVLLRFKKMVADE